MPGLWWVAKGQLALGAKPVIYIIAQWPRFGKLLMSIIAGVVSVPALPRASLSVLRARREGR